MKVLQALKPQFLHIVARLSVNRCREYTRKTMKNSFLFSKFISLGKTTFIKARGFSSDNKNVLYTWRKLFNYEQEFSNFISSLYMYVLWVCLLSKQIQSSDHLHYFPLLSLLYIPICSSPIEHRNEKKQMFIHFNGLVCAYLKTPYAAIGFSWKRDLFIRTVTSSFFYLPINLNSENVGVFANQHADEFILCIFPSFSHSNYLSLSE